VAANADGNDGRLRNTIAATVTSMWIVGGVAAVLTGEVQVFVIATGPFGLICGYLFGATIVRRKDEV
jgi:hypothetical protein